MTNEWTDYQLRTTVILAKRIFVFWQKRVDWLSLALSVDCRRWHAKGVNACWGDWPRQAHASSTAASSSCPWFWHGFFETKQNLWWKKFPVRSESLISSHQLCPMQSASFKHIWYFCFSPQLSLSSQTRTCASLRFSVRLPPCLLFLQPWTFSIVAVHKCA